MFGGTIYTSPPLVDGEELTAEWRVFKRALAKEMKAIIKRKKLTKPPTLQDVKAEMECSDAYIEIFPEILTGHLAGSPSGNSYTVKLELSL